MHNAALQPTSKPGRPRCKCEMVAEGESSRGKTWFISVDPGHCPTWVRLIRMLTRCCPNSTSPVAVSASPPLWRCWRCCCNWWPATSAPPMRQNDWQSPAAPSRFVPRPASSPLLPMVKASCRPARPVPSSARSAPARPDHRRCWRLPFPSFCPHQQRLKSSRPHRLAFFQQHPTSATLPAAPRLLSSPDQSP